MHNGRIFCASTAAGPAFEGAGIHHGMSAMPGAISGVSVTDGGISYDVIGGGTPTGICGSGVIDAVAAFLWLGWIDETGAIVDGDEIRFPNSDVIFTQSDVRAVQLAKSAICAGIVALLYTAGISSAEVQRLVVAGGFGNYMKPESAAAIGLFPRGLAERAETVGNSAGAGAVMQLLSREMMSRAEEIARRAETVELSGSAVFTREFVERMGFDYE
jgi:uncharacterized 2Fe-2S/4Fe-4S cluster protein (DUF4445 family)